MLLKQMLFAVENEFKLNWAPEKVHFGTNPSAPESDTWINLQVIALDSEGIGYGSCSLESHMIYVTCYASNQVKAADLADRVAAFTQNRKLGDYYTGNARPIHQADVNNGTYFYRIGIALRN